MKASPEVIRQGNLFIVTLRPNGEGDLGIESVIHAREVGEEVMPKALIFRHRYNPDMRAFWFPAPADWTKEDVADVFDQISTEKRREYYNKGVNLG